MGRIKLSEEKKKKEISLSIDKNLYLRFEALCMKNKSQFFNWLLEEYLNTFNQKGDECE